LANGGPNTIDYIIGSPVIWQVATHLKVIIDDTRYCATGVDSDHEPLRLWLSIDCSFVESQHTVVTKKFLFRFKYDKSKVEKYQLALTMNLGNVWVVNSIRHLGVDGLADLLQKCVGVVAEFTFGSKPSRGSYRERHYYIPWFDTNCHTMKHEVKLWLKANLDSHTIKH